VAGSSLISTRFQPGGQNRREDPNRFNGFSPRVSIAGVKLRQSSSRWRLSVSCVLAGLTAAAQGTMTKVSICIPTYNSARYLGAAIDSALAQSYRDFELVICDNASTDGTQELCSAYADKRVKYLRFETLVGQAANWNRCLDQASCDFIVLLHADDMLLPDYLDRATSMMNGHPEAGMLHCAVRHITTDGAVLSLQQLYAEDRLSTGDETFKKLLLEGCIVNPAGAMVRREVYDKVGRFTEKIVWGVDWHMWLRIAISFPVAYLAEPLALYREHSQSGTTGVMATARNGSDEMWMIDDILSAVPGDRQDLLAIRRPAIRQAAHRTWCFAEEMCRLGYPGAARAGIRRSIAIRPAMMFEGRVWALWAASYLGYEWFSKAHGARRKLGRDKNVESAQREI
jgi:glycosyltransferase involved in cell wall biosynthesis